jgi:hypothetical protein
MGLIGGSRHLQIEKHTCSLLRNWEIKRLAFFLFPIPESLKFLNLSEIENIHPATATI